MPSEAIAMSAQLKTRASYPASSRCSLRVISSRFHNVRFGSLTDILRCGSDVGFTPESGHGAQGYTSMRSIKLGSSPAAFELFTLRDTGYICSDL
jgi:hypothetical protein